MLSRKGEWFLKIKRILSQHRRDFYAIYECEHCGYEYEDSGYDDAYFHNTVIPEKICPKCGKSAGSDYRPLAPKYPEDYQI